jgi:ABC-type dipeptide/oligopeptide/nickel transport system ATPase component
MYNMLLDFILPLKRIKVFALVGASGTGKSFRAKLVAQKHEIEYIIDDGLLIKNNRILAGHSAKKRKNLYGGGKSSPL